MTPGETRLRNWIKNNFPEKYKEANSLIINMRKSVAEESAQVVEEAFGEFDTGSHPIADVIRLMMGSGLRTNIEIKAKVHDFQKVKECVEALADGPMRIISQDDVFFNASKGRLKLRVLGSDHAQLIWYDRPDTADPRYSEYFLFSTNDPVPLKKVLEMALGVRGTVRKVRYLYTIGQQTRVHLDDVAGLARFVELEVILRFGQPKAEGKAIVRELMGKLGIGKKDLVEGSYLDLIERQK